VGDTVNKGDRAMKIGYILFFVFLFCPPVFAYIDPGTGSMLFSLLTGLAVTVFFFMKNFIIKIKNGFITNIRNSKEETVKQTKREHLVIYSEGKQYWNTFKPILEELDKRGIAAAFYTSSEDDPGLSFDSPHIQAKFIGKGNTAYGFLNFLEADICLMTTPGLDVFQLKRSPGVRHYAHILHAVTDATTYRLFGVDYYDSLLLTGDYQKKDIRTLEKQRGLPEKALFTVGCTYLDVMSEHLKALEAALQTALEAETDGKKSKKEQKTVLLAPSWGANAILRRYGLSLLEPLAQSSYHVVIRPHPQTMLVEKDVVEKLRSALSPYGNVEWNFDTENLKALAGADALISDFSGIVFDYAFLFGRPVVYPAFEFDKRPYDLADIDFSLNEPWTFRAIREIGVPLDDTRDIETTLDSAIAAAKSTEKSAALQRLKDEAWMYPGEAGKRVADILEGDGYLRMK
jgi:hypothetical protein